MRAFIVLVSFMALGLGFLGAALGVRPRPVNAASVQDAERIAELEARIAVLGEAMAQLENRFEEHCARMPARLPASATDTDDSPAADAGQVPEGDAPEATGDALLLAAVERAESLLAAGDAGGARALFRELLARPEIEADVRTRLRLGVADSWRIVGADDEARTELEGLLRDLGCEAPEAVVVEVRRRLDALAVAEEEPDEDEEE